MSATFERGDRVRHVLKPEWGVGEVLGVEGSRLRLFFIGGGFRDFGAAKSLLERAGEGEPESAALDLVGEIDWEREHHHNLYVIELNADVMKVRRFRDANPDRARASDRAANRGHDPNPSRDPASGRDLKLPCVYVGMTGLSPEERFENHKQGVKSSWFPKKFGERLLPELYEPFNPLPYELAALMEEELAEHLRSLGYAVWWN